MRLRSFTISEKPTSSSREARRGTVGEVVTVWNRFLPALCVGRRIIAVPPQRSTKSTKNSAQRKFWKRGSALGLRARALFPKRYFRAKWFEDSSLPRLAPQEILLRKSFKSHALSVSVDTSNSARVTCRGRTMLANSPRDFPDCNARS